MIRFEVKRSEDAGQGWYWRIVSAANGEVIATSETYVRHIDAVAAVGLVIRSADEAWLVDELVEEEKAKAAAKLEGAV